MKYAVEARERLKDQRSRLGLPVGRSNGYPSRSRQAYRLKLRGEVGVAATMPTLQRWSDGS